jgi:hypothetical protein
MNKTSKADPPRQHAHQALAPPMDPAEGIEYDKDPRCVLDSGASMHISFDIRSFHTLDLNPYDPLPIVTFGTFFLQSDSYKNHSETSPVINPEGLRCGT